MLMKSGRGARGFQRRMLGELEVSAVGLGCATMTPFYDEPDEDAAIDHLAPRARDRRRVSGQLGRLWSGPQRGTDRSRGWAYYSSKVQNGSSAAAATTPIKAFVGRGIAIEATRRSKHRLYGRRGAFATKPRRPARRILWRGRATAAQSEAIEAEVACAVDASPLLMDRLSLSLL
jgi:hypothetical protein